MLIIGLLNSFKKLIGGAKMVADNTIEKAKCQIVYNSSEKE